MHEGKVIAAAQDFRQKELNAHFYSAVVCKNSLGARRLLPQPECSLVLFQTVRSYHSPDCQLAEAALDFKVILSGLQEREVGIKPYR
jgi:hypothetical protein